MLLTIFLALVFCASINPLLIAAVAFIQKAMLKEKLRQVE